MVFPEFQFPFELYSDDLDSYPFLGFTDHISPFNDPHWPSFPIDPIAENHPGSDPVSGSDSVTKSVTATNADTGVEVIKAPANESSDPTAVPGSDLVSGSDSVSKEVAGSNAYTGGEVIELQVGDIFDPPAIPLSDPYAGSHPSMPAGVLIKGCRSSKQQSKPRIKRARGSWKMGCGFYNMEVAGSSNQTAVDSSRGKQGKHSRKGTKDGKESTSGLPRGWTIIRKTRTRGASAGVTDKYYKEPITHKLFRSKIAVKRYLEISPSPQPKRPRKMKHRDQEDEQEEEGSSAELSF